MRYLWESGGTTTGIPWTRTILREYMEKPYGNPMAGRPRWESRLWKVTERRQETHEIPMVVLRESRGCTMTC